MTIQLRHVCARLHHCVAKKVYINFENYFNVQKLVKISWARTVFAFNIYVCVHFIKRSLWFCLNFS